MTVAAPDREAVGAALAAKGFLAPGDAIELDPRNGRVSVRLGDDRIAWFPSDDAGQAALAREQRVLNLLAERCSFAAPRTIYEDPEGWVVRDLVPGEVWPDGLRQRLLADPGRARGMGAEIGAILAEQHTRIRRKDVEGWLPGAPDWPRAIDLPHLPDIVGDAALLARIDAALTRYDAMAAETDDVVLAHADLGFHNIAVEPGTDRLMGVFDYDGAIAGDRYHDFKYLFLGDDDSMLLDATAAAYEPLTGVTIDLSRVRLFHAVAAIAFLAHRNGHAPGEIWCGRTLDQDLAWTAEALGAAGF